MWGLNDYFSYHYGSENPYLKEEIEGSFKHKFTSPKRTRYSTVTYVHIPFKVGEKAKFGINSWEIRFFLTTIETSNFL